MADLKSVSIFAGTGQCNANCKHCAGTIHRKYAPKKDGIVDLELITKTLKDCYGMGARSLSISSSGEPTLSPKSITKVLGIVSELYSGGMIFNWVNLYSNGIKIGKDQDFSNRYLPMWKELGLKTIYITVHDIDEKKNALVYGIPSYPDLRTVFDRIHDADLNVRANLVLSKKTIGTYEKFVEATDYLIKIGADLISAWPIRGDDDNIDRDMSPLESELDKMESISSENYDGGCKIRLLREKSRELYRDNKKLTLFPDGTLSNTWC